MKVEFYIYTLCRYSFELLEEMGVLDDNKVEFYVHTVFKVNL